jgi:DNA-binding transcriptional LysR family regulator
MTQVGPFVQDLPSGGSVRETRLNGVLEFLAVAERGGFAAAARALGVTPSALSQKVRALETRIGAALLVRTTRSVNLTDVGRRVLAEVGPPLRAALAAIEQTTANEGEVSGTLRITVPRDAVPHVIDPIVRPLASRHPRLLLDIAVDDRMANLVEEGFDVGIRLSEAIERDMVAVRVVEPFRFVIVGAPDYLRRRGRPRHPRDLLAHDGIVFRSPTTGAIYHWELERRRREQRMAVPPRLLTNDGAMMVRAARDGLGLAYVSERAVAGDLASGALELVLEEWAPAVPGFFAYFPVAARKQRKVQVFLEALRAGLSRRSRRS